jgi:hypothetical protein
MVLLWMQLSVTFYHWLNNTIKVTVMEQEYYMEPDDAQAYQANEEAYYHFVLMEFAELSRQFGAHKVAVDLNRVRREYKYNRK